MGCGRVRSDGFGWRCGAPSIGDVQQRFDGLLRVAARVAGTPLAAISLVDDIRAVVRNGLGIPPLTLLPADSPCATVTRDAAPLVVPDTLLDPRFRTSPIVTGPPGIRFYLGLPIPAPQGQALGSLCCMDTRPRHAPVPPEDLALLADLAAQVGESMRQEAEAVRLDPRPSPAGAAVAGRAGRHPPAAADHRPRRRRHQLEPGRRAHLRLDAGRGDRPLRPACAARPDRCLPQHPGAHAARRGGDRDRGGAAAQGW